MRLIVIFLTFSFLISCGSGDDALVIEGDYIATWFEITNCDDSQFNVERIFTDESGCYAINNNTFCSEFTFTADGILSIRTIDPVWSTESTENYNYELDNETLILTFCDSLNNCSSSYFGGLILRFDLVGSNCIPTYQLESVE